MSPDDDRPDADGFTEPDDRPGTAEDRLDTSGARPGPSADAFRLPDDVTYLNCAYMSPLPRTAEREARRALRRARAPTGLSPSDFFEESDRIRARFARLVGGEPERVAIVPSVSYGAATVARNLTLRPGQNVVLLEEQFPSNVLAWTRLARDAGAEVRTVARPEPDRAGSATGERWTTRVLEAMDPDTALVALPQAHWTDGTLLDLAAVGERAGEVEAVFVVDATQTIGAHPFRLDRVGADAVFCAGYKWLLGPYGLGLAWFGERFEDARPLEETWLGRRGSEDFAGLVDYQEAYRPGADRFDVGERSHFLLAPMLSEGLGTLLDWGVDTVAGHAATLGSRAAAGARELGFRTEPDEGRCSNIVGLAAPPAVDPGSIESIRGALEKRDVHVSVRGRSIRVSPHVYNDASDVDLLLEGLAAAV